MHAEGTHEALHRHDYLLGWCGAQFLFAVFALDGRDGAEVKADKVAGDGDVENGVSEGGLHGCLVGIKKAPARRLALSGWLGDDKEVGRG